LYCCTVVLLYCCTVVLLYCCTVVLLYCCTVVLLSTYDLSSTAAFIFCVIYRQSGSIWRSHVYVRPKLLQIWHAFRVTVIHQTTNEPSPLRSMHSRLLSSPVRRQMNHWSICFYCYISYLPVLTCTYLRSHGVIVLYGVSNATDLQHYFTALYAAYVTAIATSTAGA